MHSININEVQGHIQKGTAVELNSLNISVYIRQYFFI